jgi:hypothetical protein
MMHAPFWTKWPQPYSEVANRQDERRKPNNIPAKFGIHWHPTLMLFKDGSWPPPNGRHDQVW